MASTSLTLAVDDGDLPADLHLPAGGSGPGIVLFQEIFGVTDYVTQRAEDLAGLGYVVLVPHLYWRIGDPVIGPGESMLEQAMDAMGRTDWATAVSDGVTAVEALRERDEVDGPLGLVGFCYGGGVAFNVAAQTPVDALVSYYGSALPQLLALAPSVTCPSLHVFGLADTYIPEPVVREVEEAVTAAAEDVTFLTYAGAGHAFDNPDPLFHHETASAQAWVATQQWLEQRLPTS